MHIKQNIQHNYLRTYRNRSTLTQGDIASIMDVSDLSTISRWEQGERRPNLGMLLIYHLLFDIPIEFLFERQKHELTPIIAERIQGRILMLKEFPKEENAAPRITFLEAAFERLTNPTT